MSDYRTDEEQLEAVKDWWKNNGTSTIVMIVLALFAYFGGMAYRENNKSVAELATNEYDLMLAEYDQKKDKEAKQRAQKILKEYEGSIQSANAAFLLAKMAVENGDLAAAEKQLTRVKNAAPMPFMQNLARVRLARVLSQQGQHDKALSQLTDVKSGKLHGLFEEVKGDIFLAKGDIKNAKAAYTRSLEIEPTSNRQSVLRMKLDDLNTMDVKANES